MSQVGDAIKAARKERGWSRARLAEEASALPGAPDISDLQVFELERGRSTVRLDDPTEPTPFVLRVLGVGAGVLLKAIGWRWAA